ncbi:hypothetical protein KY313_03360 [Candidatus Woesearchaeota archaeon]|nr:hypothetical protein [Candidatus Woesearchaeota archaeon]
MRVRLETKKYLIIIAVVRQEILKDSLGRRPNFIKVMQFLMDINSNKDFKASFLDTRTRYFHRIIKNYLDKGLIKKEDEVYVLTDKAWDILGDDVKRIFSNYYLDEQPIIKQQEILNMNNGKMQPTKFAINHFNYIIQKIEHLFFFIS